MTFLIYDCKNSKIIELLNDFFIIDGSNIAYKERSNKKPKFSNIQNMREKLKEIGINQILTICDNKLYFCIDDQQRYLQSIKDKEIIETPEDIPADFYILQKAIEKNACIISNDKFREYYKIIDKDWIEDKRIPFRIVNEEIFFNKLIINKTEKEVNDRKGSK